MGWLHTKEPIAIVQRPPFTVWVVKCGIDARDQQVGLHAEHYPILRGVEIRRREIGCEKPVVVLVKGDAEIQYCM